MNRAQAEREVDALVQHTIFELRQTKREPFDGLAAIIVALRKRLIEVLEELPEPGVKK